MANFFPSYNGPIQQEYLWKYFGSKLFDPKQYPAQFFSNRVFLKLTLFPSFWELVYNGFGIGLGQKFFHRDYRFCACSQFLKQ